jgi:hypothetical protein
MHEEIQGTLPYMNAIRRHYPDEPGTLLACLSLPYILAFALNDSLHLYSQGGTLWRL